MCDCLLQDQKVRYQVLYDGQDPGEATWVDAEQVKPAKLISEFEEQVR